MLGQKYLDGLREVLDRIGPTQGESLARAADLIAEAVAAGGAVHLLDTGHLLMQEMFGRVGGLMLLRPVKVAVEVENPGPARPGRVKRKAYLDEIPGLPEFVLDRSDIFPGDVLIVGSVSGKNVLPVGVALLAKGLKPHVYLSNHLPGADEFNRRALAEYERPGY
ncbi:MAG TPA: SIS domain-containing protein [Firmicutes bacterium]|nr:SIS domain-containing protein [Bacillota bacterium]